MNGISFVGEADVTEMSPLATQKHSNWLVCDGFFLCCLRLVHLWRGGCRRNDRSPDVGADPLGEFLDLFSDVS